MYPFVAADSVVHVHQLWLTFFQFDGLTVGRNLTQGGGGSLMDNTEDRGACVPKFNRVSCRRLCRSVDESRVAAVAATAVEIQEIG